MKRDDRGDPVERRIRERDLLRAALLKSNRRSELSALGDFPPVRLQDDHFRAPRGEPFRRGARAAPEIEEANPGRWSDEGAQLGEVGRALADARPFHPPEEERRETFSRALRSGGLTELRRAGSCRALPCRGSLPRRG